MNEELAPPDERFWFRYSRHHELPLSGVVSAVLHIGTLALLLLGVFSLFGNGDPPAVPMELVDYDEGGGQGGKDDQPLLGVHPGGDVTDIVAERHEQPNIQDAGQKLDVPKPVEPIVKLPDEAGDIVVPRNPNIQQPLPKLAPLLKGSPEGTTTKGTGTKGDGTSAYPKGGKLDVHKKRQIRWTMSFRTIDVRDYVRQLQALGATIGIQHRDGKIQLVKDLSRRPVELQSASKHPERIFWLDDNPQSVAGMTAELQLTETPWRIIAYFPETLENKLLEKELAYGKRFGRNSEEAIRETRFEIRFRGGQARMEVVEQK